MKRRRLRRWAKWACTIAAGAAVGVAVVSGFYRLNYSTTTNAGDRLWSIGVYAGQVLASRTDGYFYDDRKPSLGWDVQRDPEWFWGYAGETTPFINFWKWHAGVMYAPSGIGWVAGVSVLHPVLLFSIPAALLWYADRRRFGPHQCQRCGYDRAGLLPADAPCPECGKPSIPTS